jgi:hypothetical protein
LIGWLYRWIIKKQVKAGPLMFRHRDDWFFVDGYGRIWIIKYTHWSDHDSPLSIILYKDV